MGPVIVAMGATSIVNSTFRGNHIQPDLMADYGIITSYNGAPVRYHNLTFESNASHYNLFNITADDIGSSERQVFFGTPIMKVGLTGGDFITSAPLNQASNEFLTLRDERLATIRQVCSPKPRPTDPLPFFLSASEILQTKLTRRNIGSRSEAARFLLALCCMILSFGRRRCM